MGRTAEVESRVIEDEPEMNELIRLHHGRRNLSLIGAVGGREGWNGPGKSKPGLELLDMMMPDMDGWEVYQHIRPTQS
jgi:DNA-binding response OmpR family regulator